VIYKSLKQCTYEFPLCIYILYNMYSRYGGWVTPLPTLAVYKICIIIILRDTFYHTNEINIVHSYNITFYNILYINYND